MQEGR